MKAYTVFEAVKRGAAFVTDRLAEIGERMPGVSQITIAAPVGSVTVVPKPPASPPPQVCPHCGVQKP